MKERETAKLVGMSYQGSPRCRVASCSAQAAPAECLAHSAQQPQLPYDGRAQTDRRRPWMKRMSEGRELCSSNHMLYVLGVEKARVATFLKNVE
jgi:hypothetical protein